MAQCLQDQGVPSGRIRIIPNWADGRGIVSLPTESNALRREWGLQGQFVVGYSGNMGRVHQFDTILKAAERLHDQPNIVFLFIGGGHYQTWLEDEVKTQGLKNVRFKPYQPREHLSESLCVPDVHLISLRSAVGDSVVPSKFYGVLAAGKPTLYVGDTNSDIAYIARKGGCGLAISEGDVQGLVATIVRLKKDLSLLSQMGTNARELFERWYDFPLALDRWCQVLVDVGIQDELLQPRFENLSGVLNTNRGSHKSAVKLSR
jgi:glycosyltransferase involved in cell wall biosynthesis